MYEVMSRYTNQCTTLRHGIAIIVYRDTSIDYRKVNPMVAPIQYDFRPKSRNPGLVEVVWGPIL